MINIFNYCTPFIYILDTSLVAQTVKVSAYNGEDLGSIPGSGRSHGEGNPLQYSCLENPMDEETGRLQPMRSQRVRHD